MKKRNLIFLLLLLLIAVKAIAVIDDGSIDAARLRFSNATNINQYNVNHTLVNQNPDPAEPGRYVEVRWKLENFGGTNINNLWVELLPSYPFSLEPGDSVIRKVGTVYGNQIGDKGIMIYYKLRIDKDAIEGNNEIRLRYSTDSGNSWVRLEPYNIRIKTHDTILSVLSVVSVPSQISPGKSAELQIRLKNMADSPLKNIKAKLGLADAPFVSLGTTDEKEILRLDSKDEISFWFNLTAESDAESKIYKVPLYIDYQDDLGNKYKKNNTFGLVIGEEPRLSVMIDSSEVYTKGDKGDVTIKLVNKGVTDLKLMNIKLKQSPDYNILTSDAVYVGNIDSDDYETADFKLYIQSPKQSVALPVSLDYRDANNKEYKEDINLNLKLYSRAEAKRYGFKKSSKAVGIFLIVIIVGAGLFLYKKWKKKRLK